jgi:hypothetical protein
VCRLAYSIVFLAVHHRSSTLVPQRMMDEHGVVPCMLEIQQDSNQKKGESTQEEPVQTTLSRKLLEVRVLPRRRCVQLWVVEEFGRRCGECGSIHPHISTHLCKSLIRPLEPHCWQALP